MQKKKIILPLDMYSKHLIKINEVEFTPREIDVISCILNRRGSSIAPFLSIGQRAVETHIRNIRQKAGGLLGREQIIDFIEKSGKFFLIKNEYYLSLRLRILFEEKLNAVAKKIDVKSFTCLLVYGKEEKEESSFVTYLREHLKRIGFEVKIHVNEGNTFLTHPNEIIDLEQINHVLYILPEHLDNSQITQINMNHLSNVIFLLHQNTLEEEECKKLNYINMLGGENYYLSFFEILKRLLPHSNFEDIVEDFKEQYALINRSSEIESLQEELNLEKKVPPQTKRKGFLSRRKGSLLFGCITVTSVLSICFFVFKERNGDKSFPIHYTAKQTEPPIRSDLALPSKTTLLNRLELITEIDSKFKDQDGIQAVALVGIGGSGKTTIARHYGHQQKANIVWEINAETNASLMESFENLAYSLSKTEEDKKILRELQEIKNSVERSKKLVEFVKKRLKLHSNWLLIYDNAENFTKIQQYFPTDVNTWGEGKVILTTRNHNIQNNRQVDGIILMGELNANQKLALFMKIMNHGENKKLTALQKEELMGFLEKIPPFPLDVSVAAYYLKTTNIPYATYLECLDQQDTNFTTVQENLLKEAGEYTKTRNSIITLSLKHVIDTHKDFGDLLLFISLLDSQNIPKELLDAYKKKNVVDNFIYHLKKYSLIMDDSLVSSLGTTFSLHRCTQNISLAHFMKTLNLKSNTQPLQGISIALQNYMVETTEKQDFSKLKLLLNHYEKFLNNNLLTNVMRGFIEGELGSAYVYLCFYLKAKIILEKSLKKLNHHYDGKHPKIIRFLIYLGIIYRDLGHYEKSKSLLEQSLMLCKKYCPENSVSIAWNLTHLGHVYSNLGNYEKAKSSLKQSLALYKKNPPKNNIKVAWALTHLGVVYEEMGDYKKAKTLLEQSLIIYKQHISENHFYAAWALSHLGFVYGKLGNYEKAKELLETSLVTHKRIFGKNHIETAPVLRRLGQVYLLEGRMEKAKPFIIQALRVFLKNKNPESHISLESLSELFLQKSVLEVKKRNRQLAKKFKQNAIYYLRQALKIVKTHFPADSPHITRIQDKLKKLEEGTLR